MIISWIHFGDGDDWLIDWVSEWGKERNRRWFHFLSSNTEQTNEINKNVKCYENDVMGNIGETSFCGYSMVMEGSLWRLCLRRDLRHENELARWRYGAMVNSSKGKVLTPWQRLGIDRSPLWLEHRERREMLRDMDTVGQNHKIATHYVVLTLYLNHQVHWLD